MSEEDGRLNALRDFFNAPPPNEEESQVFNIAYEVRRIKDAIIEAIQKINTLPQTEYLDQRKGVYRKQIRVIDAWVNGKDTHAPEIDPTIYEELDLKEILDKESILRLEVKKRSIIDQPINLTASSSPKNFFHPNGKGLRVGFQGEEATFDKIYAPLKAIAERLRHPHQPKLFNSTVEFNEENVYAVTETEPASANGPALNVNQALTPEFKANIEERALDLHIKMTAKPRFDDYGYFGEDVDDSKEKFRKLQKYLSKMYNARLKDNATIEWGRFLIRT